MLDHIEKRKARKVDLERIIQLAIHRCEVIESWNKEGKDEIEMKPTTLITSHKDESNTINKESIIKATVRPKNAHTPSVKAKQFHRLAQRIDKLLGYTNDSVKHNKIALTTYTSYLSDVRTALQGKLNLKHPNLKKSIEKMQTKYPFKNELQRIIDANALEVKHVKAEVLEMLTESHKPIYRQAHDELTGIKVHHELVGKLVPVKADLKKRKKNMSANKEARNTNVKIINYMQVKGIIEAGLASDDFYELVLAVALATGRRAIEVARVGEFRVVSRDNSVNIGSIKVESDVLFKGVAKKRFSEQNPDGYIIPTEYNAQQIVGAVDKLRNTHRYLNDSKAIANEPETTHNTIINRRIANGLNKCIKYMLGDNIVFKDSRGIAGAIARKKFKDQERYKGLSRNAFYQKYYIHDTLEQSTDYGHFEIDYDNEYVPVKRENTKTSDVVLNANVEWLELITEKLMYVDQKGMNAVVKLHHKVIEVMRENAFALSLSSIYKGKKYEGKTIKIGGSQAVIKRYLELEIVQESIEGFHEANGLKTRGR
jgi:hypothetical protein